MDLYLWSSDGYVLVNDRLDVASGIQSTAGDVVLYDNINMGNTYSIINLPAPTNSTDAANKSYVDNKVSTNLGYYFWTTSIINGASDGYQHLVTLPATTTGTLDGTTIEIYGGPWTQYPYAATVRLTNRDNYGGYIVSSRNFNNNLKIKTFIQADNTVQVWAHLTGTYQRYNLNITSTNYSSKGALATVTTYPPGTLLWDSGNTSASYGDVTSNSLTSTDNSLVRFDGTSGKIVQNSLAVLDDTGNLNLNSGAGLLTCGTPTISSHAATKGYVDGYFQSWNLNKVLSAGNSAGNQSITNLNSVSGNPSTDFYITSSAQLVNTSTGNLYFNSTGGQVYLVSDSSRVNLKGGTSGKIVYVQDGNIYDPESINGKTGYNLGITSNVNINMNAGASFVAQGVASSITATGGTLSLIADGQLITNNCASYQMKHGGTEYEYTTVSYTHEQQKTPTLSSINQVSTNAQLRFAYEGAEIIVTRLNGSSVPVISAINYC